ncbi:MAG: Na+/H+ antiporter [Rhodocyclaceae bacterium]|nr:Na+/H+ antiporter [Rhodocyclaceae bacterium]
MHIVTMILTFFLAVVVSAFVARLLPGRIPLPLLQIGIGAVLSMFGLGVNFDSHLFLLLFIPPLLFLDGWRIPKGAFFSDWGSILTLAIGLVVFTVIGLGYFIDWLVPAMPLAVAFALAAILSPTDPVAVATVTANAPLPSRLMHILEGEALLNDATGLVCFSFAVAAVLTGGFSFGHAALSFLFVGGGGVVVGVLVPWSIGWLNQQLVKRAGEEPGIQILISLLIPFAAYLVAERIGVSGILSAAVAGIAMHYSELSGRRMAATRMQRAAVWDTVQLVLNGIIFVLLGEQLPRMLARLPEVAASLHVHSAWHLGLYAIAITIALWVLRYVWVWLMFRAVVLFSGWRGASRDMPSWRLLIVTAAAGVRGAITLAGILTLPFFLPDHSPFPARDAAIFLSMAVILLSLAGASICLPLLARGLTLGMSPVAMHKRTAAARIAAAEAAVRTIEVLGTRTTGNAELDALRSEASAYLLDLYRRRLSYGDASGDSSSDRSRLADVTRSLRLKALSAERDELYRQRLTHGIDDDVLRSLVREIDLTEASLANRED